MKPVDRISECDIQVQDFAAMFLEGQQCDMNQQFVQAFPQNEKLVNALSEAREQMARLKEEVDRLCAPPSSYGVYLSSNDDGTVNILFQAGRPRSICTPPSNRARSSPVRSSS